MRTFGSTDCQAHGDVIDVRRKSIVPGWTLAGGCHPIRVGGHLNVGMLKNICRRLSTAWQVLEPLGHSYVCWCQRHMRDFALPCCIRPWSCTCSQHPCAWCGSWIPLLSNVQRPHPCVLLGAVHFPAAYPQRRAKGTEDPQDRMFGILIHFLARLVWGLWGYPDALPASRLPQCSLRLFCLLASSVGKVPVHTSGPPAQNRSVLAEAS
mmetsp:Transcript_73616/g.145899  ORF Transcript_73616/g.145899 Transcript_73616/m.145899 type:complete len:208 (-) Transcript_73616:323-946(-)